jgi:putative glutamine amidotransferase
MNERLWIGITADLGGGQNSNTASFREPTFFLHERYCREILRAGGLPLILPALDTAAALDGYFDALAGLVITGGDFDIHPRYYGEAPIPQIGLILEQRTESELALTERALGRDLPILGICGGAQAINVALGGSLYQDIAAQVPNAGEHQLGAIKDRGGHMVSVESGTLLAQAVGERRLEVNSTHHQAVKQLGKNLIASARAEDRLIEALESTAHRFVLGVQWHPEVLAPNRNDQRQLFSRFVSECKRS